MQPDYTSGINNDQKFNVVMIFFDMRINKHIQNNSNEGYGTVEFKFLSTTHRYISVSGNALIVFSSNRFS
jgi:hypothetical protein